MSKRSDRQCRPKSNYHEEASMNSIYYIGLDIHKKVIAYCIKRIDGALVRQGTVAADGADPGWIERRVQSVADGAAISVPDQPERQSDDCGIDAWRGSDRPTDHDGTGQFRIWPARVIGWRLLRCCRRRGCG